MCPAPSLIPAILLAVVAAACGADTQRVEDISHVLPGDLPAGWTLGHATERLAVTHGRGGQLIEVSDYVIVWRPADLAGTSREDSTSHDRDPSIWLATGSRYYEGLYFEQLGGAPPFGDVDAYHDDTPVSVEQGNLVLTFRVGCCVARLYGSDVEEDELRRVAASLDVMDREAWRDQLGDRLLVDDGRAEDVARIEADAR